jgi:threonine-phosphate decarboxylase
VTVAHGGNVFEIARERGWNWREVADFSASINPLGPSPAVAEAVRGAVDRIALYPEREPARLRRALAELWGIDERQILLGNGATELLHWFARVWTPDVRRQECRRGKPGGLLHLGPVTLTVPVFSEFHRAYPGARCAPAGDPARWPREGLVVLTQPNNPTGAALDPVELERWLLATDNPALVDESFLEFTGLPSAARLMERRPRLWVLRSLTKFYALPGLRVGALIGSVEEVERRRPMREPWQVNVLAEAAALAAITDREHGRRTLEFVASERAWLSERIAELPGARPEPSRANYLFVRLAQAAEGLCAHLLERKILVRDCTGSPGVDGSAARVAVRTRVENERLIAGWKEYSCGS